MSDAHFETRERLRLFYRDVQSIDDGLLTPSIVTGENTPSTNKFATLYLARNDLF